MRAALLLARRGLGNVWPNPAVGCVLVKDGRVVGRGWTQPGGRPHAETEALAQAGAAARGATAYVSLEPCSHHGKTPPCAEALIAAGVARVVAALEDPDPRVSGRGLAMLRAAGISVECGLCADEAAELNAGFLSRIRLHRPLVTLKLATTLDGRIATRLGESRWITGPEARAFAHRLRAESDAILVGSGTALADNPDLTCRLPGLEERSPVRIVADGRLRLPLTGRLVASANETPTWVLTLEGAEEIRRQALIDVGVEVIDLPEGPDHSLDMASALDALGDSGITRLLVEGGSRLAAGLLRARLVDRLVWLRAPSVMGGDGLPAAQGFGVQTLAEIARFQRISSAPIGQDVVEFYKKS